jgi:phosphate/sulfate permease
VNNIQIKNIMTPLFGLLATYLATKLNFLGIDQSTWNTVISSLGFGAVALILGLFTKTTNLMDTVGNQPGTTVVTTHENAAALPDNKDVIAVTPQIANAVRAAT